MALDFSGQEIHRGDIVMVPCEVLNTQPFENRTNITVVPIHKGDPRTGNIHIHLTASQVIKNNG